MAAKYLYSLADENPDLQKQLRCVKGVFQIFNRHHICHTPKKARSGSMVFNNRTPERKSNVIHHKAPTMEKHRKSNESCNSSRSPEKSSTSRKVNHQNLDLRDVVKDSMYREARGLSITKKESNNWYYDEPKKLSRSKSCQFKDGFSISLSKEQPRLSLDSKDRSFPTLNSISLIPFDPKPDPNPKNPRVNGRVNADKDLVHTRPPSVVAKLMGLETYPDTASINNKSLPKSLNGSNKNKSGSILKIPNSTKNSLKTISRVPIETASGKQSSAKIQNPMCSVYSEMDKRLKNLEFSESGRDLRALKQILEAMQSVETKKGEKGDHKNSTFDVSRSNESHIVIMKPAKVASKDFVNNKVGKDCSKTRKQLKKKDFESRLNSGKMRDLSLQENLNDFEYCEESNSRQRSSSTPKKSSLLVKVGELLTPEYPSPVSVLDDSIYLKNSINPQKGNVVIKDEQKPTSSVSFNREKLKKIQDLVQKLKKVNSDHDESQTDYIASLCEYTNPNPNNRYISEILLASGILLKDLKSFEFHSSGNPINPDLFLVLENMKFRNLKNEKFHRKLLFDSVNEILVEKLSSDCRMMQDSRTLLRELCLEIECMQVQKEKDGYAPGAGELKKWGNWTGENSLIVVEIERLIFRDLVNEVVMSEL